MRSNILALDSLNYGRCKRIQIAEALFAVSKLVFLTPVVRIGSFLKSPLAHHSTKLNGPEQITLFYLRIQLSLLNHSATYESIFGSGSCQSVFKLSNNWLFHPIEGTHSLLMNFGNYEAHLSSASHPNPKARGHCNMLVDKGLLMFPRVLKTKIGYHVDKKENN